MPVALHGEEQEAVGYLSPTSCTRPRGRPATWHLTVHHGGPRELLDVPKDVDTKFT